MEKKDYINQIIEKLKPLNPYKVILFGSYAHDTYTKDSDIDLLVVTNDEVIPNNFQENMKYYLKVARILDEIRNEVAMDLLVHTLPMHQKFIELDSMFAREILKNGKILYESHHQRLVESSQ